MRFAVTWFQFGAAASTAVSGDQSSQYGRLLSQLYGKTILPSSEEPVYSLPFSFETIVEKESIVYQESVERFNALAEEADVILIDLSEPLDAVIPGKAELHVAAAISLVCNACEEKQLHFVLLRQKTPEQHDAMMKVLGPLIEEGHLIIVSDDGEITSSRDIEAFEQETYQLHRAAINGDPNELLKARMIRRRGHYHKNGSTELQTFFFDGSACAKQIYQLVSQHIERNFVDARPTILYHCNISEWLIEPALSVANALRLPIYDAGSTLEAEEREVIPSEDLKHVLLIVPRIETRQTVERLIRELQALGAGCIELLTIVSTHSKNVKDRSIEINGIRYAIPFLMHDVPDDNPYDRAAQDCVICEYDREAVPSQFDTHKYAMLTTFTFYLLAFEAGWKPEDDTPRTRESLKRVPNFPSVLSANGAFIASRMLGMLQYHVGENFPAEPFLIAYPDELGAGLVAGYLKAMMHVSVTLVQIPRTDLERNLGQDGKTDWEQVGWQQQISSAPPSLPIVLMEEFTVSRSTKVALKTLMAQFDRKVSCHVAIADFSDPQHNQSIDEEIPTFCLYRTPLGKAIAHTA